MTTQIADRTATTPKTRRHIPFRIVCALEAVVYLVAFGMYRAWLTPWTTFPDTTDHGWARTPELHRWADSAAAAFYLGLVAALLFLAVRPARSSGLLAWVLGLTGLMGVASAVSMVLQQHTDVAGAAVSAAVVLLALAGPLLATAPDRRGVLRGGRVTNARLGVPSVLFVAGLVVWAVVAVGAVVWRTLGGRFESPLEDDVISFVLVGLAGALGSWQVLRRREGRCPLAWIVGGMSGYAVVAALALILG